MFYVYILQSSVDNELYIGCTQSIDTRVKRHNLGHVKSTRHRRPLKLTYSEAYMDKYEAFRKERLYKTAKGKRILLQKIEAPSSSG